MSFRQPKRPLNCCNECGHTWYPRGSDLSVKCPHCGSRDVGYAYGGDDGLGCLIAFVVLVAEFVVDLAKAIALASVWLGVQAWPAFVWVGHRFYAVFAWFVSIKDDLFGPAEREVNTFELLAKLILIAVAIGGWVVLVVVWVKGA